LAYIYLLALPAETAVSVLPRTASQLIKYRAALRDYKNLLASG
jgi:hypothetical protein